MRDGKINHPFSFQQIDGISETLPFHSSLPCIKLLLSLSVQVIFSRSLVFTLFWIRFSMNSRRRLANALRFMSQFFKSLSISGFFNVFFPYCRLKSLLFVLTVTATWWWMASLLTNDILLNILDMVIHGWLSSAELQLVLLLGLPLNIHLWSISCYC